MTNELREFLAFYLPGQDLGAFLANFTELKIKKGKHLLTPGKDCNYIAFIQQGCFRVYYYDIKDKEIITWFSFKEMVITDLLGFYTTGRAQFYVEALEDSILYKITKQDLENLYEKFPIYREFGRKFAEEAFTILMQRTHSLHTKSAEERYKELLRIPDFIQKVPLKYLASYLGVTDTSLSRIRKKIR
ncbi:MAG: Crp family transcriptional regulator [Bacteroidetes bacterium]|nr:MAG: Crp family transcriptional regulator [Bacteroidota bacterium]